MTLRDKTATAWSNLGRRKVRTALTSVGVVVGILTIVTMVSLVNGVRQHVKQQFEKIGLDRVVVRPPTADGFGGTGLNPFDFEERTKLITPAVVKRWRTWPQVQEAVPEVELPDDVAASLSLKNKAQSKAGAQSKALPVQIKNSASPFRRGMFAAAPTVVAGRIELPQQRGVLVVSQGALKRLKLSPGQYSGLLGQAAEVTLQTSRGEKQSYTLKLIGVSSDNTPTVEVSTPERLAMKSWWFNEPNLLKTEGYDAVTLRAADVSDAKNLVGRLRKEKYQVQSIDAILDVADRIFTVITAMLSLISGVALLVACIGIANTMIMSIYERTREIGTLKAMGASNGDIRLMFMMEAGFIGLIGGAVGLLLSWLLGRGLNRAAVWYAHHRHLPLPDNLFIITPELAVQSIIFALLIGVLAGLYPAHRAARLDPLTALRHE